MHKKKKRFLILVIFLTGCAVLWSRSGIAQWYVASSDLAREDRDYTRALDQLNRAVRLQGNNPDIFAARGRLQLEMIIAKKGDDFEGCIDDFTRAIQASPGQFARQFINQRSDAYLHWASHLEDGKEQASKYELAIKDLKAALDDIPDSRHSMERASALNSIAYARALANIDIEQGLIEIEEALETLGFLEQTQSVSAAISRTYRGYWLDTRGYLRYRAGMYEQAKEDMEQAIRIMELQTETAFGFTIQGGDALSVMYFHRGKIYEALQYEKLAELDLRLATKLGYPDNGSL